MRWFTKYPGRFSMWHIKDMEAAAARCSQKANLRSWQRSYRRKTILKINANRLDYAFVEQEQYRRVRFSGFA
jgi:hypothetical protein